MSPTNDELRQCVNNTAAFLRQQRELYGDEMRFELSDAPPKQRLADLKQPSTETDLFGAPEGTSRAMPSAGKVAEPARAYPEEAWTSTGTLDGLNKLTCACTKCVLGRTRKNFVFGVGNPTADVVVIGEAPGADEDEQGEPFVGRAGQLLNKILEAVHFKRDEVYICNILKCRPPENRKPAPEEIELCEPYLWKQLEIIKPKMILVLGLTAAQALLKTNQSLGNLRGKMFDYRGIKLMVTYHPAALLRNPNWKRPTWEDVQLFRKEYERLKNGGI